MGDIPLHEDYSKCVEGHSAVVLQKHNFYCEI